ncbi:AMP-binding protein [Microbacterium abyssi]|uniref:AMP-binding protein n=1 Tax=Microbacterium abyssi TaxID=2782166 RepID=UPI0018895259|nr:AMP-binding protein [Microbacterium sp. A18JL241]
METFAQVVRTRIGDGHEGLRFEGRSWSWGEIVAEAATRASLLRTFEPAGGRPQRHVGLLMQNVPDFVFWILAIALNGDVMVGINPTRRGAELAQDIRHVDCDLLVTEPFYEEALRGVDLPFGDERLLDVETQAYAELIAAHSGADVPSPTIDPASIFMLLFSSGSTGAPKAVICSQGRLGRLTEAMTDRVSVHRDSVNYLCLPLFHGHAIMMNLATALQAGATIVMVRRFSASRFVDDVREHRVTFFNYVGRVLSYIVGANPPRDTDEDNALEVAFGSEAAPAEVDEFRERFGCEVREGYGASEGMVRIVPVEGSPRHSLGLPAAGVTVEVRDEDGQECPRARFDENGLLLNAEEATGEMVVLGRGPAFEGYYKNPKAMSERLRFGGEDFWTGDLGYRDADGYFYFGGRSSDWVRVDGENFGLAPVERILLRFDAFASVHCYGVPDAVTGDLLMCAATLHPRAEFDPVEFGRFLDAQSDLGTKWRPTFVRIVSDVPLTGSGKVNKAPLRAEAWEADDVWWAPARGEEYRRMGADERDGIKDAFLAGGRQNALPAAVRKELL